MKHEKGEEIMRAVAQLTGLSRVDHRALHTSTQMAIDPPAHSALRADFGNIRPFFRGRLVVRLM